MNRRKAIMSVVAVCGLAAMVGGISRSCHKQPPKMTPKQIYDAQMYMRFRGQTMQNMPEAKDSKRRHVHTEIKTP